MNLKPFKLTEAQRKATLRDGQNAGELLLDIESRIGEIALKEKPAGITRSDGKFVKGKIGPKHKRLKIEKHRMVQSQQIAKHPEIVEKVKAQARANEDIPPEIIVAGFLIQ